MMLRELAALIIGMALVTTTAFATQAIDLYDGLWSHDAQVVDGHIEYEEHGSDLGGRIFTMRYVVTIKVRCLGEELDASRFVDQYLQRQDRKEFVSLRVLTSYDPRVCNSRNEDRLFTITSRNNTTNEFSAPRAIVVNGFEIPVHGPR